MTLTVFYKRGEDRPLYERIENVRSLDCVLGYYVFQPYGLAREPKRIATVRVAWIQVGDSDDGR